MSSSASCLSEELAFVLFTWKLTGQVVSVNAKALS